MLTTEDLDAIEVRANAATPVPWPRDFGRCDFSPEGCMAIGPLVTMDDECDEERQAQADQDFIAAARTDVPRLVAELRRLRAFVAKQAEDEGLWAEPITISEAYIQRGLRYLHLVVEGDNFEWKEEGDD